MDRRAKVEPSAAARQPAIPEPMLVPLPREFKWKLNFGGSSYSNGPRAEVVAAAGALATPSGAPDAPPGPLCTEQPPVRGQLVAPPPAVQAQLLQELPAPPGLAKPQARDVTALQACNATRPQPQKAHSKSAAPASSKPASANAEAAGSRWWTHAKTPLVCSLTKFPISLLPYPPFKLVVDPGKPSTHRLVDGKYVALQLIVGGNTSLCIAVLGRVLLDSDISALDEYIRRCKLGPFRPGKALALMRIAANSASPEEKANALKELEVFKTAARRELVKLSRIQSNRRSQIQ